MKAKIKIVSLLGFISTVSLSYASDLPKPQGQDEGIHWDVGLKKVEIPLQALFAPYSGYDNTNNVEVTLYGNLPNPCYRLDKIKVEKDTESNTFKVHQYAVKKTDGVCGEENAMPQHMQMIVPFTNVVSLGSLKSGNYRIYYQGESAQSDHKTVSVKEAHKTTIDDFPYAAVSNASTSDVVQKDQPLSVNLTGVFTSSCAYLDQESVKVEKQNDVYVVLPVIKMKSNVFCAQSLMPFSQKVVLDAPGKAGAYLVHVRSMNGKSLNHVVEASNN